MRIVLLSIQVCVCRALLRGNPEQLGAELGDIVLHADARAFADMARGNTDYASSLVEQLGEDQEALVNPEVTNVVSKANKVMMSSLVTDALCDRAYSVACPDGWVAIRNLCVAPPSYAGGCARTFSPAGKTANEKTKFADMCTAPWPCSDGCLEGHNYDNPPCPIGWYESGHGLCNLRKDTGRYQTSCSLVYYFGGMDVAQKQQIAKQCSLQWSCLSNCEQDFSGVCPEGWSSTAGVCVAPLTYAGRCSHGINVSGMSENQLNNFSDHCLARFPCREAKVAEGL